MAEEHSNVMEQRVEELAEMREGAMARRENLLQENAPEKKEESEAPEGEKEEEKGSEDEQKASSEKAESYSESYYSSSSEEEEGPKEAEKPKEGEGHKTEDYILLSEEGLWAVTRQSALLDEENRMILEGENALNMDFVRSERLKQIYDDFQTRMKQPTEQLPDSFGSQVEKWGAEAMDLLTDLRDSEEIIHGDRDEIEQRLDGARKKFEKKKEEIAESLKEADGLKKEMDEAEKEFQEATEEVKDFQISKDVVKGVVVMMRTAGEVMKALIDERPEFGRLFEKKRERVSLYDLIKKKREAESEAEPMGKEPMGKASEKKGVTMQPKTKAMPKRAMNCEAMAQQALDLGGVVPTREDRIAAGSSLFCKHCFLTSKEDPRTKMCGTGKLENEKSSDWPKSRDGNGPECAKGFPKEELEEAKKEDEVKIKWSFPELEDERKAKMAKAKAAKESVEKEQALKAAKKKKSGKKEKKEGKAKKEKKERKSKKENKETKTKKKAKAPAAEIQNEDL
ncbi:unnamed protein product [Symbiodinium natans]|uniref:Uncharacterized protein n=1 Tax=Symbiodinium natans TaxID=878477 RepID=A0A812I1J3_9DINO|nr:unnamed protein product [Symbiodinium natans]